MGAYEHYDTSDIDFNEGQWIDYGDFQIKVLYAGSENKKYEKTLEQLTRKYRRLLGNDDVQLSDKMKEKMEDIYAECFAKSVIIDWKDMTDRDGNDLEFTEANVKKVLVDLPMLFKDLREVASSISTFREEVRKEDEKN